MGFSDRLGQFGKDLGGFLWATPKFIWDVATAPLNDAEEYNGLKNTLVTAGGDLATRLVKPIADVASAPGIKPALQKLDAFNREYIREPLTTAELILAERQNLLDSSAWGQAHRQAQNVSFGQGLVGAVADLTPGEQEVEKQVDWNDPLSVQDYFSRGPQKIWSGFGDAAIQVFGDVSIGVGKVGKAARGAEWATNSLIGSAGEARRAQAIVDARRAGDGEEVKNLSKAFEDFAANDGTYAYNHPMLKEANNRGVLAHALGQAQNVKDVSLVWRAGLGDESALDELAQVGRYDVANSIGRSQGMLDAAQRFNLKAERNADGTFKNINEDANIHTEIANEEAAFNQYSDSFKTFLRSSLNSEALSDLASTAGGSLKRTVGNEMIQNVEKFIAQGRSAKYYDLKRSDESNIAVWQPTPFHRMYQIVSWPAGIRPAGHVNLNDPESSREISAVLDSAMRRKIVSGDSARKILNSYLAESTPEGRAGVVYDMERFLVRNLADKHGIDLKDADTIYANYKRSRATALETLDRHGYGVDVDGSKFIVPQFESQLVNSLPVMNFDLADAVFKRHNLLAENADIYRKAMGRVIQGADDTVNLFDTMQSLFKIGALLRLGYTVRNGLEAQLRIASSVGSMAAMRHLGPGVKNLIYNTGTEARRAIDGFVPGRMRYEDLQAQGRELSDEIAGIESQIADINRQLENDRRLQASPYELKVHPTSGKLVPDRSRPKDPAQATNIVDNPDHLASLEVLNTSLAERRAFLEQNNAAMAKYETRKARVESGFFEHKLADGRIVRLPEAFNQSFFGDIYRNNSSASESYMSLADTSGKFFSRQVTHTGYGEVTPNDPHYWTEYAYVLNNIFANSEIARKLANRENPYNVISWLLSEDGRALRNRMNMNRASANEHVMTIKRLLDQHAPDDEIRRMVAEHKTISPELLRSKFTTPDMQPVINGHVLEENLNLVGQRRINGIVTGLFKLLGSMPEDAWARHPMYAYLYKESMRRRVEAFNNSMPGRNLLGLTDDEVASKELLLAMRAAHQDALAGTKRILFTIDHHTNLASTMKFISPFFAAYENSVKTWARLAADKPQIVNRAYLLYTAPNRMGIATDANGNKIAPENASMNDYIWLDIPKSMTKLPFVGKGLESLTKMGIQKRSLDVVFQGDSTIPIGPYVSIPISEIVKAQPSYEQSLKWALPFGAERNAAVAMLPSWLKKQITKSGGQGDPQYANTYMMIWNTEQQKRKDAGQPAASADEIKKMTDAYWNMRTVANLILPFAPQFNTPYKMYTDAWHQYQVKYGKEASQRFWLDYGDDMFKFTMSLSKNYTGSTATVSSVENAKRYKGLVAEIAAIDPKMVGIVTETGNASYQFSDAAYKWQQNNPVAPGSDVTFRGTNNPAEAVKENEIRLGWIKYRDVMNQIDAEMVKRNITNINAKGAEDLRAAKKLLIDSLATDENGQSTAWYDDWASGGKTKYTLVRKAFDAILNDKKFMADHGNDPTWKSVALYLNTQDLANDILAARYAAGYPSSITAKANADVAAMLQATAVELKKQDIGFGDLYDRYFSYDPVFDPHLQGGVQ